MRKLEVKEYIEHGLIGALIGIIAFLIGGWIWGRNFSKFFWYPLYNIIPLDRIVLYTFILFGIIVSIIYLKYYERASK